MPGIQILLRRLPVLAPGLVVAALVFAPLGSSLAADASPPAGASPGFKVNVDPKTGRFLETPAPEPAAAAEGAGSMQPLAEEPNVVPGGGVGIRLTDKRFNAAMHATTSPDGAAQVDCDQPAR